MSNPTVRNARAAGDVAGGLPGEAPGVGSALDQAGERLRASTVRILSRGDSTGGGVAWSENQVVTNAHVLAGDHFRVETLDGRLLRAHVERQDGWRDLALLSIEGSLTPAQPGDEALLRPASLVIGLGHPMGWAGALSIGIVHRVDRGGAHGQARWIAADVRLAPGNSGGPLADAQARVVGINTMVSHGLGLAVPVSAIGRFLVPTAQRRRLGVAMQPVAVRSGSHNRFGMIVVDVVSRGAAASAGVTAGDVVLAVDGFALRAPYDFADALHLSAGEEVRLHVMRDGRSLELLVHPEPPAARAA